MASAVLASLQWGSASAPTPEVRPRGSLAWTVEGTSDHRRRVLVDNVAGVRTVSW